MSETTRNEKCTDCEHAGTCSSAGFDLTCATGKWARRGAPQRTEETMPEEIRETMRLLTVRAEEVGLGLEDGYTIDDLAEYELARHRLAEAKAAHEAAILRALRSPADRIAELEARVGTLSVALEMARSAEQALAARHGGEPLALLSELDEAREKLAAAEQERNEVWMVLTGIDLDKTPADMVTEFLTDPDERSAFLQAWRSDLEALLDAGEAAEQARDAALQRAEEAERSDRANAEDAITQAARADVAEAKLRRVEAEVKAASRLRLPGEEALLASLRYALSTPDKKEPTP